jgi:hypothetical protein
MEKSKEQRIEEMVEVDGRTVLRGIRITNTVRSVVIFGGQIYLAAFFN